MQAPPAPPPALLSALQPAALALALGALTACGTARPPAVPAASAASAAATTGPRSTADSVRRGELLLLPSANTPVPGAAEAEAAVRAVLDRQVAAWNAGDVRGFMEGYSRTDSLTFASGGTLRRGWQTSLYAYVRNYPDRAAMGTLAFDVLDLRVLAPDAALVVGRWGLTRAGDAPGGLFSLVFRRGVQGWRIVHDHTSSSQE